MTTALAPTLTASDRCDRCGAQAYVRAILPGDLTLLFCAHHSRAHLDRLAAMEGVQILDETDKLTEPGA